MARFEMFRDVAGHYRWKLFADDGRTIATSWTGWPSKAECTTNIEQVQACGQEAEVDTTPAPTNISGSRVPRGRGI